MYPTFGMKHYSEIFGLASWIPGGASYLGCSCVASTSTDSSGIPEYTPNNCNTDLSTVPVCGVFDNSYTLDARFFFLVYSMLILLYRLLIFCVDAPPLA